MTAHKSQSLDIEQMASLKSWGEPPSALADDLNKQSVVDCGWGRLLFAQTFNSTTELAAQLRNEAEGQRDVALYTRNPQVVLSQAPQELFIDPSLTYRLDLKKNTLTEAVPEGLKVCPLRDVDDEYHVNRIFKTRGMVPLHEGFYDHFTNEPALETLVAIDRRSNAVIGTVTGVDHHAAFQDPDNGSSLWALAVDPQCLRPGVGRALVVSLAQRFKQAGRSFMDLSVMHDNQQAIQLYTALGFYQVPVYCIKKKNAINERLYIGPKQEEDLNIYAQIIIDEAYRRGIAVEVVDAAGGFFDLSLGGRTVSCRESLTDFTSAVALSRCDDKEITHRFLQREGLNVPTQTTLENELEAQTFLEKHQRIVIKPAQGEQGTGVFVDLKQADEVREAYRFARGLCDKVIGEQFIDGHDLRIIVIDNTVVAAAIRKPASIVGDGVHSIHELIHKQSRRRKAATQGESEIPIDAETKRCIADAGFGLDQILPSGTELRVRKTANLHTGGTLHDVTSQLHPVLIDAAVRGALALKMPLVGFDFIVQQPNQPDYVIIEANERPGLANHEPQPTAKRFIDMLFPQTITEPVPEQE
jgi:GNAT-family acetyltransferase (TIGR03103 family)